MKRFSGVAGGGQRQPLPREVEAARRTPAACIGLLADRGKTGAVTSPRASSTAPSAPSTTRLPRCRPSTKPDRTTSARTGGTTGESADVGADVGADRSVGDGWSAGDDWPPYEGCEGCGC